MSAKKLQISIIQKSPFKKYKLLVIGNVLHVEKDWNFLNIFLFYCPVWVKKGLNISKFRATMYRKRALHLNWVLGATTKEYQKYDMISGMDNAFWYRILCWSVSIGSRSERRNQSAELQITIWLKHHHGRHHATHLKIWHSCCYVSGILVSAFC